MAPQAQPRYQVAALPLRKGRNGRTEVMLITSRERHRWIIPKGWPMPGKADHEAAATEAFEEAGLQGKPEAEALGSYEYDKIDAQGRATALQVQVYPLHVTGVAESWPEKNQRVSLWYDLDEALIVLDEPGLAALIGRMRKKLA